MSKPNFLILMVDQLTGTLWDDGPAEFLHAPNLKKLHKRSVNFSNTYSPNPLCTPARASFMTGLLASGNTVYDNAAEFPSSLPTFAHYLRRAGYQTALSGKMHFVGADQLHGFEERLTTDIYPADFGWTPDWRKPFERVDWWYHNLASVTEAGVAHTSNQLEYDDEVVYHARAKLLQLARRQDERPFCLTASFTHPHDPYTARPEYWALYDDVELPKLNVEALDLNDQDPHSARLFDAVDHTKFNVESEHINNARRAYYANISYLDEKIGELLDTLDACNFADDTVVMFISDHGDMLGERGLWYKMCFFEGAARIPFSISMPSQFKPHTCTQPATACDVLPTLLELAGIDEHELAIPVDGHSLVSAAKGTPDDHRMIAAEYMAEGSVSSMLMLRKGPWKYVYCENDPTQLYHLDNDPHELENLANNSAHQAVLEDFDKLREQRWRLDVLNDDVKENQQKRILVYDALRQGRYTPWDYQPITDATQRYMRNHLDLNKVESAARVAVEKNKH